MRATAVVLLIVVGLYLLIDHKPPMPFNHEDMGLGEVHLAHNILGVVALAGAAFIVWRSRRSRKTTS
jgi:hypothetical protein